MSRMVDVDTLRRGGREGGMGAEFSVAVGVTAPIELGSVGASHPKNSTGPTEILTNSKLL